MDTFEIVAFENQSLYDRMECQGNEVVENFVNKYCEYFNPEYYTEPSISFERGMFYLSYTNISGDHKPIMLMLIGPITGNIVTEIKDAVKRVYDSPF